MNENNILVFQLWKISHELKKKIGSLSPLNYAELKFFTASELY